MSGLYGLGGHGISDSAGVRHATARPLTDGEVAQRVAAGQVNRVDSRTSRTLGEIVRANVVTPFNGLLFTLFVVVAATGRWQNALFGLVIVANSAIGIIQELRAKRMLDRLALLNRAPARVVRAHGAVELDPADIVLDDVLELRGGDQVPVDADVVDATGLELDESLLTGEADPVSRHVGESVRSGSLVVAGYGVCVARSVGADSYAERIAASARRFSLARSELVASTNTLLRAISVLMVIIGPFILWSQFRSSDNHNWQDAVTGTSAALVGMVPEGLVLLTSVAFMVGVLTLARQGTLVQELPAVEGLARVDVICLDKTGTLTVGDLAFDRVESVGATAPDELGAPLAAIAAMPGANATAAALRSEFPEVGSTVTSSVEFSSARKWSAVTLGGLGTWVFGAPEVLLASVGGSIAADTRRRSDEVATGGERVVLLARAAAPIHVGDQGDNAAQLGAVEPVALVVFREQVRDDAPDTLRFFAEQGVTIKVISGDNPRTVAAVAARAGVPGTEHPGEVIDARELPVDPDLLAGAVEGATVFGRTTPEQKRAMVLALQRNGHVVAMTGDGVNDALALKDADIGVAMGSGSAAARAVAQIVLLDGRFAHLPQAVAEGRRVVANIERAASLFLVKNVYSLVLAVIAAVTLVAYPLAPIQLTLISTLSIGIPGFFLSLWPNRRRYQPGFLGRALRVAVPAGVTIAAASFASYRLTRTIESAATVDQARSTATIAVLAMALWTLGLVARPLTRGKIVLLAAVVVAAVVAVLVPPLAHGIFLLDLNWSRWVTAGVTAVVGAAVITILVWRPLRAYQAR
ncbi:MAG TPA: HAD-IC family P-type ATPase [Mycobacteriales bacterium]|nr:HAD-IC family P-type ATPase [Mycobacteriales bacterium]